MGVNFRGKKHYVTLEWPLSLIRQAECGDEHFRENCNVH